MHGAREHPAFVLLWNVLLDHDRPNGVHNFGLLRLSVPLEIRFKALRDAVVKPVNACVKSGLSLPLLHCARIKPKSYFLWSGSFFLFVLLSYLVGITYINIYCSI